MNIVNAEHIKKIYGEKIVFNDASVGIQEGEKIGIIGINGTGKSTFLKILAGLEQPDSGEVVHRNNLKIAYLPQNPSFPPNTTLQEYINTFDDPWKITSILDRLGMTDEQVLLEKMSGGQRRKTALAVVLSGDFDLLLLDEPTNHLDEAMISWLESYLKSYKGTLLMVTHDRYFLDQVANRILEISHGSMYLYEADYSRFLELKAQREESLLASERKRQSLLRMELEWAKRGCRARSTKQRARLERLEMLKNGTAPTQEQVVKLDTIETRMGKKTIELSGISKSFGEKQLVKDYNYIFLKNQNIGIIGPNGCGKSTLLRMIAGLDTPDLGKIEKGETIKIAYLAQEEHQMDEKQRVIDYVRDIGEYVQTKEGRISASQMLERFLFTPDMQYSPIGKLSGGEKRRLYLLGVLCQNCNVLLLDEAGNNLDIPTITILEDFIQNFSGIVVAVSHDRYFLDTIADRILEFDGEGGICQYEGGYSDYLKARLSDAATISQMAESGEKNSLEKKKEVNKSWKEHRQTKLKFSYKEKREFETIDEEIEKLEEKLASLDHEIMQNATEAGKLNELTKEKTELEKELDEKTERWVYLNELADQIAAQD